MNTQHLQSNNGVKNVTSFWNVTLKFKDQDRNITIVKSLSEEDLTAIKNVIAQANTNKGDIKDHSLRVDNLEAMNVSNTVTVVP